jgi:hypothetical protein
MVIVEESSTHLLRKALAALDLSVLVMSCKIASLAVTVTLVL